MAHIKELLKWADPNKAGIDCVQVYGDRHLLAALEDRTWLEKVHVSALDDNILKRVWWQSTQLSRAARDCDLLFIPAAGGRGQFRPYVAMSQNMLPFEKIERERFGKYSPQNLKLLILHRLIRRRFKKANGMIFLGEYARETIQRDVGGVQGNFATIPHGIDPQFNCPPRQVQPLEAFTTKNPVRLLYVSPISPYKHQKTVVCAVANLRSKGFPLSLTLAGGIHAKWYAKQVDEIIQSVDPDSSFINYKGHIPYEKLGSIYRDADIFIFASTCENLPITLLEAMASGLPILSSNKRPMPEILQDGGLYFDPESSDDLENQLLYYLRNKELRETHAHNGYKIAQTYSWELAAEQTFEFLARCARTANTA